MITIDTVTTPELQGAQSFKFKTEKEVKETRSLKHRNKEDQTGQFELISKILAKLEKFMLISCAVSITTESKNGHVYFQGRIKAYSQSSAREAHEILREVDALSIFFSQNYSASSFIIQYSQTITITEVHGPTLH